jgi:hypothetical protein
MNDRNLGKFTVTTDYIRRNPDEAAQIFKLLNLVVVRAECMFANREIEYTGLSDQFVEIEMGEKIPDYRLEISTCENGIVDNVVAVRSN